MIYLYDNAIVEDLEKSFNPDNVENPVVRVVSPDQAIAVAAQIKEDQIDFPLVVLERNDSVSINSDLVNFTRKQKGVQTLIDKETNMIYYERAIPIKLEYTLTVLTTNQVDMDEIMRELIFKYESMYFLGIRIPYESKREISFGVSIDSDYGIQQKSGSSQYIESGQLYESSMKLNCDGCVLIHYTPQHLRRLGTEIVAE